MAKAIHQILSRTTVPERRSSRLPQGEGLGSRSLTHSLSSFLLCLQALTGTSGQEDFRYWRWRGTIGAAFLRVTGCQ